MVGDTWANIVSFWDVPSDVSVFSFFKSRCWFPFSDKIEPPNNKVWFLTSSKLCSASWKGIATILLKVVPVNLIHQPMRWWADLQLLEWQGGISLEKWWLLIDGLPIYTLFSGQLKKKEGSKKKKWWAVVTTKSSFSWRRKFHQIHLRSSWN